MPHPTLPSTSSEELLYSMSDRSAPQGLPLSPSSHDLDVWPASIPRHSPDFLPAMNSLEGPVLIPHSQTSGTSLSPEPFRRSEPYAMPYALASPLTRMLDRPTTYPVPSMRVQPLAGMGPPPSYAPFRFLDLPLEIRTEIYALAFMDKQSNHSGRSTPTQHVYIHVPALSHVNSEMRVEALTAFFSRATFCVNLSGCKRWSSSTGAIAWLESAAILPYFSQLRRLKFSLFNKNYERTDIEVRMAADETVRIKCDHPIPVKWWKERRLEPKAEEGGNEKDTIMLPGAFCVKRCNKLEQIRLIQQVILKAVGSGSRPPVACVLRSNCRRY